MKNSVLFTLMNQLVGKGINRKDAYQMAKNFITENQDVKVLKFYKKDDKNNRDLQTRVVTKNLTKFNELKGGATTNFHPKFTDVVKHLRGERFCIISAIPSKIVRLAA